MHATRLPLLLTLLAACAPLPRPGPNSRSAGIDTVALRAHTWYLAQNALRGRGTGDPVTIHAAHYIVAQCRALGLLPVGDSYLHPVPLVDVGLRETSTVEITGGGDSMTVVHGRDFVVTGGDLARLRQSIAGRALWLGEPDSLAGVLPDLSGRIGVTAGVPGPELSARLAAAGALALVALVGDDARLSGFAEAFGTPFRFATPTLSSFVPAIPVILGGTQLTRALVPILRGASRAVTIRLDAAPRVVDAWNVACRLPGSDGSRADTAIGFTAHYDHLGIGTPVDGDSIYNGFSDDAAGVAMLLAIANAMRSDPARQPRHSVLFLFFTGEERGLLGSDWWVAHPAWPVERMRAVINLDAGAPPGRVWSWRLAGGTDSWLGALGQDVASDHGWTAILSAPRANSDYFPFHRVGVPAVFPIPTPAPYEGLTTDSTLALRRRWDQYHQPADGWFADFPFEGLARYAEYALWIGLAVDRR